MSDDTQAKVKLEDYHDFQSHLQKTINKKLFSSDRFQSIVQRKHTSALYTRDYTKKMCEGRYITLYRGESLMKCPEDLVLYEQLLWYVKPATLIELGSFCGVSALWFADHAKLMDFDCQIYSVDIDLSLLSDKVKKLQPNNLKFIQCDANVIETAFTADFMSSLPHPLVVVEDCHTNTSGILNHFHQFLQVGDYFVIEDTNPFLPLFCSRDWDMDFGYEKNDVMENFLKQHNGLYGIDTFFCDYYCYNSTWNWNGWIRRMK